MSDQLGVFLDCLFGMEPGGGLVELRQLGGGRPPHQEFHPVRDRQRVAERVAQLGRERDTYIGVAPRRRREGGRDAVERVHALWADVDGAGALDRLRAFRPLPSMVVRSGSPDCVHAYWALWPPATPDEAERATRRLAHAIGADMRSTDAARILRPPGTLNFKRTPPVPVEVAHLAVEMFTVEQVAGGLPDPPDAREPREPCERPRQAHRVDAGDGADALLTIHPAMYFRALAGVDVGRDGKVCCPLPGHEDGEPSCHVYDDPERGWYCFGCGRGGTIYDLARELSGLGDRGADFRELRDWIARRLLHAPLRSAA